MNKRALVIAGAVFALGVVLCAGTTWAMLTDEEQRQVDRLVVELRSPEANTRQEAAKKLIAVGPEVLSFVHKALAEAEDEEVKKSCNEVIKALETPATGDEESLTENIAEALGEIHFYISFSPDGTRVNWVKSDKANQVVVVNGKEQQPYQGIAHRRWSADSAHLAYAALQDDKWMMLKDGQEGERYDKVGPPWMSPDGKSLAYMAVKKGRNIMVVDEMEGKAYDEVSWRAEYVKGKGFAYRAKRGTEAFIVAGKDEQKSYEVVSHPAASSDGKRLVYRAQKEGKQFIVDDGKEMKAYDACGTPMLSADGKRLAYTARKDNGKWCVVVDGVETGEYEKIGSPRGQDEAGQPPEWWPYLVQEHPPLDGPKGPVFSPDGKRVACPVMREGRWRVMVDGKELAGAFDEIGQISFSLDGKKVAFGGIKRGMTYVVAEGMISRAYWRWYQGPMWSADGKHLIWILQKQGHTSLKAINDWRIVIDGIQGPDYWLAEVPRDYFKTEKKMMYNARNRNDGNLMEVDWPACDWKREMAPIK